MGDHQVRERALIHILRGSVTCMSGADTATCVEGTLTVFEPGEPHTLRALRPERGCSSSFPPGRQRGTTTTWVAMTRTSSPFTQRSVLWAPVPRTRRNPGRARSTGPIGTSRRRTFANACARGLRFARKPAAIATRHLGSLYLNDHGAPPRPARPRPPTRPPLGWRNPRSRPRRSRRATCRLSCRRELAARSRACDPFCVGSTTA